MKRFFGLVALALALPMAAAFIPAPPAPVAAQAVQPAKTAKVYATGYQQPKDLKQKVAASWNRHRHHLQAMPSATAAAYDCRTLGIVPPIRDQGQCGSCWDFAGSGIVTSALIKAGYGKNDGSFNASEQYILDCVRSGGCGGDDHATVLDAAKSRGMPTEADYGPYRAREGNCKATNPKLYKIADWGYCGDSEGVASTQSIKDAMVKYGPISVAIAADSAFMNVAPGEVFNGRSRNVNHEVILVGWDDSKGAWLLRNSWSADWCDNGYCWIKYGANEVGTAAVWCVATSILPPGPDPQPVPPGPPVPGGAVTITTSADLKAGSYQIVPHGSIIIHEGMTLAELREALDAIVKKKAMGGQIEPPLAAPLESRVDRMERAMERIERLLIGDKK